MVQSLLLGAIIIGLVHGLEPGHGWPIAVIYSTSRSRTTISALISSTIISFAHFVSSIAVVIVYVVFSTLVDLPSDYLTLAAAIMLIILGVMFIREKAEDVESSQHGHLHPGFFDEVEHEHQHQHPEEDGSHGHLHRHESRDILTLKKIAGVAFVLGFAHEEEFALLAFVMGGLNPWVLMISYALAVMASLIAATLIGAKIFSVFESKIAHYQEYLPKISGVILLIMAAAFLFELTI